MVSAGPGGEGKISHQTVEKVAKLARLKLSETEVASLSRELSAVLTIFETLSEVATDGVLPLVTPTEMTVQLRPDAVAADASPDALLETASARTGQLYKVPPVV